jgi:hypothetical protein
MMSMLQGTLHLHHSVAGHCYSSIEMGVVDKNNNLPRALVERRSRGVAGEEARHARDARLVAEPVEVQGLK